MYKALLGGSLVAAAVSGCGGSSSGSGTTTVLSLAPPSSLEIVTASDSATPSATSTPGGGSVSPAASDPGFPAGSQYYLDATRTRVYDPAIEPLQTINEILCFLGQTGAGELVNQGPYIAQVDEDLCRDGQNENASGSATGQSTGASEVALNLWTVNSTRADNSSSQLISLWVPEEDDDGDETIFVRASITESASDEDPFGQFSMNFAGADMYSNLGSPFFLGTLATVATPEVGDIGFRFYQDFGDVTAVHTSGMQSERVQVNVEMNDDQSEGWAKVTSTQRFNYGGGDSGLLTQAFEIAFDATHFLRATDGAAPVAYHRDMVQENVWSYGLYYADGVNQGQRVQRNSGFGFRTAGGDYGWMGYYGGWLPYGVVVAHGETVNRDVYSDQPSELVPYTVFRAPGKLLRFQKAALALSEIEGQQFEWWTWNNSSGMTEIFRVQYFNGSGEWHQVALIDPSTYQPVAISPTQMIDIAAINYLNMWSESLGGRVVFVDGETEITYFSQEFVNSDDAVFTSSTTLNLQGFSNCMKSGISSADANVGDIFLADAPNVGTPHNYEFHSADLTLYHDTDDMGSLAQVGLASGNEPSSGPNTWGMNSGPLVTAAVASTLINPWDVWNASEFYIWETGHNEWNRLFSLVDGSGDFVVFDKPLTFNYIHTTADDRNDSSTYNGQTFFLRYEGDGNLNGLPFDGVDLDGDGNFDRYYPIVSLDDGTALTDGAGTNYVLKAWDAEQVLTEDSGYSGSLSLSATASLTLPDSSGYVIPDIGEAPLVTDAPRVVVGVVVGD